MPKSAVFSKQIPPNQKFIYAHTLSVRIGDVNYGNHLAATAVPLMLHQVRLKFLTAQGFSEADIAGIALVVADLYVSYQCESFFDDELLFQLGVEEIGKHSAILVYKISNQTRQKIMGVAKEKIVFFNAQQKKIASTPMIFISTVKKLEEKAYVI